MSRIRVLRLPGVALAVAASCSSPAQAPDPRPPDQPLPTHPQPDSDLAAVSLGVTVVSRDERGAPRLVRAVVPRPASLARMAPDAAARDHLAALTPLWLRNQRPAVTATHSLQRFRNGASLVRLRQQIDNIEIHQGELRVMVNADGSLAAVSGTMLPGSGRTKFQLTPAAALDRALDALYGAGRARPAITEGGEKAGYRELTVASAPGVQVQTARAKRELLPDGNQLRPIWSIEVLATTAGLGAARTPVARRYLIDDKDGRPVRDIDLTANDAFVYRALADTTGNRNPLDGALQSYTPHPTGTPDGSLPDLGPYNLVVMEAFNGPRDPWLPANATTTSGNNVNAFADLVGPFGLFNAGDIRPEVRAGRTLNFRHDFTAEPLATPDQSKSAAVNLFFVTNWLHDWYYESGFTEATGNAQVDNFGRGGVDGDPLLALAQADALGSSRDNALMSTPDDGLSPTMFMFLWQGLADLRLTTPTGTPESAVFIAEPRQFDVSGTAVLVEDVGADSHAGCGPIAPSVAGKIAVVEFDGRCAGATVLANAAEAGAIGLIAAIAVNAPLQDLDGNADANLPGLVLGLEDGLALKAILPAEVSLHRATGLEHDGSFDNGVVAHEWGHYLHHRLASCEAAVQCRAMSEGWGDFVALHMMVRASDNRDGTFSAAVYGPGSGDLRRVGFADPGYFGLRRYPYSLDRTKNPLSFRHIGADNPLPAEIPSNPRPAGIVNSEPHNAGEVWAQMLWEVYNVLIDEHGYTEAHRRMSDYVVSGLLLTPPEATYTEARDAIIAASAALDTEDTLLIAAAFAGRGAGSCAAGPDRASGNLAGVVESRTIAARLETSAVQLTDDGVSCDHDGFLDRGETGILRLTVANSGVIPAEGVTVAATTTTPGVVIGRPVELGLVAAFSQVDVEIPVRLTASAPVGTTLDIALQVSGDAGCNTRRTVLDLRRQIGVNEAAAVATTDGFETSTLAWTPSGDAAEALWSREQDAGGNHVLFGADAGFTSDTQLVSPVLQASTTAPLVVTLRHAYDLEAAAPFGEFYDGGVVEVSSDGGQTWRDVTEVGVDPGYPVSIVTFFDNPLGGRDAFSGASPAFPARQALVLDFGTQFAGQAVQIRFRLGTDFCCTASGWTLDDIAVTGITNTPFPGFVPDTRTCTVRATAGDASRVAAVRTMPRASLDGIAIPVEAP